MPYYSVFRQYKDKKELVIDETNKLNCYFETIERTTEEMLKIIKNYKKPSHNEKITKPIDMDCDYNIYIYQVSVWINQETHEIKLISYEKIVPKLNYQSKDLNKYLELCDRQDMNCAKLCLEIFGENITEEQIEKIRQEIIKENIDRINKYLPEIVNKKYIILLLDKKDEFNNSLIDHKIVKDLKKYYRNLGYYLKTTLNGSTICIYLFKKSYIDFLIEKLNKLFLRADIKINNLSRNKENYLQKKYIFDKFLNTNNLTSEYVKYFLKDHFKIRPPEQEYDFYWSYWSSY